MRLFRDNGIRFGLTCLSLIFAFRVVVGFAADPTQLELQVPFGETQSVTGFGDYVAGLYQFVGVFLISIAVIIIMWAGIRWIASGGNDQVIKESKSRITLAVIGIALYLLSFSILNLVNPQLLQLHLSVPGLALLGDTSIATGDVCPRVNIDQLKNDLSQGKSICTESCPHTSCIETVLQKYGAIIDRYYQSERKMIATIICQESNGRPDAVGNDPDGGKGCGLMQITDHRTRTTCPPDLFDPETNIREGVALVKQKMDAIVRQGYTYGGNITVQQMTFAAYNCCAGGDNPNAQSRDCSTSDGWPALPKWACPIKPGVGEFNMCAVKEYACRVSACF